jgi:signal transduction histidine kinase
MPETPPRQQLPTISGPALAPANAVCQQAGLNSCVIPLLDVLGAGVAICRRSGQILYLNPTGGAILGASPELSRGSDISEVFASLEELSAAAETDNGGVSPEISINNRIGRQVHIGFRLAETTGLLEATDESQIIILFQDITAFNQIRSERDHLLRVATVSRLLPTIAHEIKNPLAGIQAIAEVLYSELDSRDQRDDISAILSEVERMRLIVDGLGLADGNLLDGGSETDLGVEVKALYRLLGSRADQLGIALVWSGDDKLSVTLNRNMLRLLLLNLIKNALEACSTGDTVTVTVRRRPNQLELRVADTGCGMSTEQVQRATELFYTTKTGGSGIGLALTDQVVRRSGGKVEIRSTMAYGTEVTLIVPQERPA